MIKYTDAMFPALQVCKDGKTHAKSEIIESVANALNLSEQERLVMLSSGTLHYKSAIGWGVTYLSYTRKLSDEKRLLVRTARGNYQITELGKSIANDEAAFERWYEEIYGSKRPKNEQSDESEMSENFAEEETQSVDIEAQIRDMLAKAKPGFFESLVVQLLVKMGYGVGTVTQATRDGGIDGVINEDRLGLSKIYVQAKRYSDTKVSSPEIDKFAGAMKRMHQEKGVFITLSDFSQDAKRHANDLNIAIIDGKNLIRLMCEYDVGVKSEVVKRFEIDEEFWDTEGE